jgi:hypothetical protein
MFLSGATPGQIATSVWAATTRSLTKMGALTAGGALNQTVATSATATIQPALNVIADITLVVSQPAGGAGNVSVIVNDGTNNFTVATVAPGATTSFQFQAIQNSMFIKITNGNNTNATNYAYTQKQWAI